MKRKCLFPVLFCICAVAGEKAAAQDSADKLLPVVVYAKTNVTKVVNDAFYRYFPFAKETEWYRINKDYLAGFISQDMKNRALFNKNGRLEYHIRYGTENSLPAALRTQVQYVYEDYKVVKAVNVRQSNRDLWLVYLEGLKKRKIVRVDEEGVEEVASYDKEG